MSDYSCKMCSETMMVMGYCDNHWQVVKGTWTPADIEQITLSV